jgi:magnesium-transporting ATPase (P-type)
MEKSVIGRGTWVGLTFLAIVIMCVYSWVEYVDIKKDQEADEPALVNFTAVTIMASFWTLLVGAYLFGAIGWRSILHESFGFLSFNTFVFLCSVILLVTSSLALSDFIKENEAGPYDNSRLKAYNAFLILTIILSSLMIIGFFGSIGDMIRHYTSVARDTVGDTLELAGDTVRSSAKVVKKNAKKL